jgi:hypothetical protein
MQVFSHCKDHGVVVAVAVLEGTVLQVSVPVVLAVLVAVVVLSIMITRALFDAP